MASQGIVELLDHVYATGEPHVGRSCRSSSTDPMRRQNSGFSISSTSRCSIASVSLEGIAAVVYDVTELVRARETAEVANRAKDEFLAMLGHELRNPLAPIMTALQLLKLRGVETGERERNVIERQVKHLVSLVDDLLDVSRITRGKIQLQRTAGGDRRRRGEGD